MTSTSTVGKVVACWLPIVMFFAQGFEHIVVNMFVIPCSMWLGSGVSWGDWWLYNVLPVTMGNILGAVLFVSLPMWLTWGHEYRHRREQLEIDVEVAKELNSTVYSASAPLVNDHEMGVVTTANGQHHGAPSESYCVVANSSPSTRTFV